MKHTTIIAASLMLTACSGMLLSGCHTGTQNAPSESSTEQTLSPTADSSESEVTIPGSENSDIPMFSVSGGFYDEPFSLMLAARSGLEIHYTTDGTDPTAESETYTSPINVTDRSAEANHLSAITDLSPNGMYSRITAPHDPVDKATIVKAVAIDENGKASEIVSQTYFIGFQEKSGYYQDLKIISIQTDEENLFDYEKGIYVSGKVYDDWKNGEEFDRTTPEWFMPGNYTQSGKDWEREAVIEIYENGKLSLSQKTGLRIHGGATRSYPQKSFNVYARNEYGAPKLEYDLFDGAIKSEVTGNPITEFDTFMLRNGGNDAMYTRFRDKLSQELVSERDFLTQGMAPCIVFINGEYWGHYELTEKIDTAFIKSHCGVSKKEMCIVKKDAFEKGTEEGYSDWQELREWICETDFSDQSKYDALCEQVDMQSFAEYMSSEIYINNANWDASNSAMWKATVTDDSNQYADGRWRFIMFDTEYSTGIYGEADYKDDSFEKIMESDCFLADLFNGALENEGFRQYFIEIFTDIAEQDFGKERVSAKIDQLESDYHDMVIDTYNRFWYDSAGGKVAEFNYSREVDTVREFFDNRNQYIMEYLEEHIGTADGAAE